MKDPPPRKSRFNPLISEPEIDYNMIAPLLSTGENLPCKHYDKGAVVKTYTAGTQIDVVISGTVFHMGGHCQFSVSYDDKTFVVIHTVLDNCFVGTGTTFTIDLPADLPKCDRCTFAWSWVNAIGNREFYMNCADVKIQSSSTSFVGKKYTVANLPGYPSIPEFPPSTYHGLDIYQSAPMVRVGSGSAIETSTKATVPTTKKTNTGTGIVITHTVASGLSSCTTKSITVYKIVTKTVFK